MANSEKRDWHKVARPDELDEGRVMTVTAGTKSMALVHFEGQYAAMDNHCPHQGGPLGEGSIETGIEGKCWLRCPWHGWDFDPLTEIQPLSHEIAPAVGRVAAEQGLADCSDPKAAKAMIDATDWSPGC